jgi:hypothetical protein
LMPDQHGFGDNGTESTRPRQSGQGDDQINEYDSEVAHPGNGINTSKTTALRPNLAIRHRQARNHQGKGNVLLFPHHEVGQQRPRCRVRCRERLGGLLRYYSYVA